MPEQFDVAFSVDALGPQLTGIGRYALELARGLQRIDLVGRVSYFRGNQWIDDFEPMLAPGWQDRRGKFLRAASSLRGRLTARNAIVHGPNYFLPDWAKGGVITVHDLSVLLYPETHPIERVRDFELRFRSSLDRAQCVITDSETVRREVIDVLGIRDDHVFHVPLGVNPPAGALATGDDSGMSETLGGLDLAAGHYTLCVSTLEPRKRIDKLIAAYGRLPEPVRRNIPLVLAGARGWKSEALDAAIAQAGQAGWLRSLHYVADHERDALYRGARLFVYPSLYEGFGLPPLEAMAFGIPTIVGDAQTLIEVTKGAARVVNVEDADQFAQAVHEMLEDEPLRRAYAASGQAVAGSYTWAKCVTETVGVYQKLAAGLT
ncbi:MAG: glycosyltransferase family 1 protein [Novosphingobium sp.]|nr:glycosyltransferase family 1 protein [Novosphingobium sp.]